MSDNPLRQYFRKPAIHVELPSKGKFYPDGALNMPVTSELPVYPMSALDDITYKTPDALFNGSAIVDVIKSCVPDIIDPWEMPTVDLNVILAAIRIASIGHSMEISSTCPKCNTTADYSFDLRTIIDNKPDIAAYDKPLIIGDLAIFFKPVSYKESNQTNRARFDEEKLLQVLREDQQEEEKLKTLSVMFKQVAALTVNTVAAGVQRVQTPDSSVTDSTHILDFLTHCESTVFTSIKDQIMELRHLEDIEPLIITCHEQVTNDEVTEECGCTYRQEFMLDMTRFFDRSS